jgi:O-antigen/teichoic acid export membrane protein
MSEQRAAYRQIMRATSIYGGVQVLQIIIGVVRSKAIALLLGPSGMGISGLLQANTSFIAALTNFGLATSAVKNIAEAHASGNNEAIRRTVGIFQKLVWGTGLLGAVITAVLAPRLSEITFGNSDYTAAFYWLSVTLLLNQLTVGQDVLLQGMRHIRQMAQATLYGSILGLLLTLPLYYLYGEGGIVPAIIGTAIIGLLLSLYYVRKTIDIQPVKVSFAQAWAEGKDMLRMGFLISLTGLLTLGASYLVRLYISREGGVAEVGLYNAGFAIINTYVGMIFTAMGADYYPRLSGVAHDNAQATEVINQQSEIAFLILTPVLILFIMMSKWVVTLLYSSQFLPITDMMQWAALGMIFKASSWAIAFIFLAKSASRVFFWNELLALAISTTLSLIGYKWGGLTGLGIAFAAGYALYFLQVFLLAKHLYQYRLSANYLWIFMVQSALLLATFAALIVQWEAAHWIGSILFLASALLSLAVLERQLQITAYIKNFLQGKSDA